MCGRMNHEIALQLLGFDEQPLSEYLAVFVFDILLVLM